VFDRTTSFLHTAATNSVGSVHLPTMGGIYGVKTLFGRWDQFLDNDPPAIGQVGWVQLGVCNHTLYHPLTVSLYFSNSF
jgi:hypothetical protein